MDMKDARKCLRTIHNRSPYDDALASYVVHYHQACLGEDSAPTQGFVEPIQKILEKVDRLIPMVCVLMSAWPRPCIQWNLSITLR